MEQVSLNYLGKRKTEKETLPNVATDYTLRIVIPYCLYSVFHSECPILKPHISGTTNPK